MRIIVAIDIMDGKCVRLTRGDFEQKKTYSDDPLEMARQFEDNGIRYLHLVDLDGAREKKVKNLQVLEKIASGTSLTIDFGGGIRGNDDIKRVLNSGASQVTAGSVAVNEPVLFMEWLSEYGPERIILGADYRNRRIAASGWLENSKTDLIGFLADYAAKGVRYTVCTDIERDGMLGGPATEMYREILTGIKINLIASGGISSVEDIKAVRDAGCDGAIIGKAFYEGRVTLKELAQLC